jgi:uncharacterized OB-fold protein
MQQEAIPTSSEQRTGLWYQRCKWCTSAQLRPAATCRICRSDSFRWEQSAGRGRVVISPPQNRKQDAPPRLMTVQLDEGPLVEGLIRGGSQEQLWVGAPVHLSATQAPTGRPVFELVSDERPHTLDISGVTHHHP